MMLALQSGGLASYDMSGPRERAPQYPFSLDEQEKLATLEGKEKKKYIKELKQKYARIKK